jgi:hypothetical protein
MIMIAEQWEILRKAVLDSFHVLVLFEFTLAENHKIEDKLTKGMRLQVHTEASM